MIRYPGHEIAIWTAIFMIAGTYVAILSWASGAIGSAILFLAPPLGSALIWFDIRPAKWLIVAYMAVAVLGCGLSLLSNGFSLTMVGRAAFAVYIAVLFACWNGGPKARLEQWLQKNRKIFPEVLLPPSVLAQIRADAGESPADSPLQ